MTACEELDVPLCTESPSSIASIVVLVIALFFVLHGKALTTTWDDEARLRGCHGALCIQPTRLIHRPHWRWDGRWKDEGVDFVLVEILLDLLLLLDRLLGRDLYLLRRSLVSIVIIDRRYSDLELDSGPQ